MNDYTLELPIRHNDISFIVDNTESDLKDKKFYLVRNGYASFNIYDATNKTANKHLLHRIIMERILGRSLIKGELVDHANGNKLDNRRCNLRLATKSDNCRNAKKRKDNKSGHKGVSFMQGKWRARIIVNRKEIHLGMFASIEDAGAAYRDAALKYHGEFARFE